MRHTQVTALFAVFLAFTFSAALAEDSETIDQGGRRIINGEPTSISEHPWQVAINANGTLCGGSIIGEQWVLTAAHCFGGAAQSQDTKVKSGASDVLDEGIWADADQVLVHSNYNPKTYENDIALVHLSRPASGVPIAMATKATDVSVGQSLEVTGWGTTETGEISQVLRKAPVPLVDTRVCNEPESYGGRIKTGMLCAGHKDGGTDSCQGDSGGPLVLNSNSGAVLIGVVSWGDGCAEKLKYGVYTSVAAYRDWIDRTVISNAK